MAYKDNWLRHLFAPLTGEGLSNALARDFWSHEDLWTSEQAVRCRWIKLVWVYSASAVTQVMFPLMVAAAIVSLFKEVPLKWWAIGVGGGTGLAVLFGVLFATTSLIDVYRRVRSRNGS
jgi:hypothetical protein